MIKPSGDQATCAGKCIGGGIVKFCSGRGIPSAAESTRKEHHPAVQKCRRSPPRDVSHTNRRERTGSRIVKICAKECCANASYDKHLASVQESYRASELEGHTPCGRESA